ncbi:MAG: AraC family transcriptional regulator [Bacteroidales bacterium]|jgi:AraC-like DNA-binding protein|nr:AraC family transcriptional regulator [Bacteroidales bacterium]
MEKSYNSLNSHFEYLIAEEKDKRFGLWVNTVGFECIKPESPYPLKEHPSEYFFSTEKGRVLNEYQLLYVTKGSGRFSNKKMQANAEEVGQPVSKGSLFILFPAQWHTFYAERKTGWNAYYIGFKGQMIDNLVNNGFLSKDKPLLEIGLNEELVRLFSRALEYARDNKPLLQQRLAGIVMYIIGMVLSLSENKYDSKNQKIEQSKIVMTENIFKEINFEELAHKLSVSYSWFRKTFKEYTGFAPAQYFQILKLNKARQLLDSTSYSIKEISFKLNYKSTKNFLYIFKKHIGCTPIEYRSMRNVKSFENQH